MRAWSLLALCACNQVFGIRETGLIDAALPGDGPGPDAPYSCPPIGTTPTFTGSTRLALTRNCFDISGAAGNAVAICLESGRVEVGTFEGGLAPEAGTPAYLIDDGFVAGPRLSPSGDELLVRWKPFSNGAIQVRRYTRSAAGWTRQADLPLTGQFNLAVSAPSMGPTRHLVYLADDAKSFRELSDTGSGWSDIGESYPFTSWGLAEVSKPQLSSDGLRLLFHVRQAGGEIGVWYSDRPSVDARFRTPQEVIGAPLTRGNDPYMSDDCGRIYMSDQGAINFAQQLGN